MKKYLITENQLKNIVDNLVIEQNEEVYHYPGDNNWSYKIINGKWYTQKIGWSPEKWVKISDNPKYQTTINKLDKQFPNTRPKTQISGIPLKNTPNYQNKQSINTQANWNKPTNTQQSENITQYLPFKTPKGSNLFLNTFKKYYPRTFEKYSQNLQQYIVLNPNKYKPQDVKKVNDSYLALNRKNITYKGKDIPFGEYFKIIYPNV